MKRDQAHSKSSGGEQEERRESGLPGGGQGRRDEVGHSGVYPMSGPHPEGDAEIKGQAAWGQGERGAAGYEDHGTSELTYTGGQVLGAISDSVEGPSRIPDADKNTDIVNTDIVQEQWVSFLDSFSREHQGWLATIEVVSSSGRIVVAHGRALKGISIDQTHDRQRVYIHVGDSPDEHVTHTVDAPTGLRFKQIEGGRHAGLEIRSSDGTTSVIRFRTAARPETLDGIAA